MAVNGQAPSIRESILRMVADAFPQLFLGVPRTYVVTGASGGLLTLSPPPGASYLPPLANVPQWSLGGATVTPSVGARVVVVFVDASAATPIVVGFAPQSPSQVDIDATFATLGLNAELVGIGSNQSPPVRYGEVVTIGAASGAVTFVSSPFTPPTQSNVSM